MRKRNEFPDTWPGFFSWVFQKAFWKGCLIFAIGAAAVYMWTNFSCDGQGPRIDRTEFKKPK